MEPDLTPVDGRVAVLAAKQQGHVTRRQLLTLGLGTKAINYRLRIGRLHRVHPGVYAVGHRRRAPVELAAAAVLACGPGAVLSDFSAAALWGFVKRWPERRRFRSATSVGRAGFGYTAGQASLDWRRPGREASP